MSSEHPLLKIDINKTRGVWKGGRSGCTALNKFGIKFFLF